MNNSYSSLKNVALGIIISTALVAGTYQAAKRLGNKGETPLANEIEKKENR